MEAGKQLLAALDELMKRAPGPKAVEALNRLGDRRGTFSKEGGVNKIVIGLFENVGARDDP
jgi:hypothetical protein